TPEPTAEPTPQPGNCILTLDYNQYGEIYGPITLNPDESFPFQQEVDRLATNEFTLQEKPDLEGLEPEDVVGSYSFHLVFRRENTPWKYEFFGDSNYVRVSDSDGTRWYLAESAITGDAEYLAYMESIFGSTIADYAHRQLFCRYERQTIQDIRIPCTEFDQTAAISWMIRYLSASSEYSPGNPHGLAEWTILEVFDLNDGSDGRGLFFRCMYTVVPHSPQFVYGYAPGEEIPESFTYTRTFVVELTEDGYLAGVS
ncbi:MAG: hypothetical protein IJC35_01890, partial [Oscillospiraceae bacterium]|nr:hypothetical protein [Oscillospiraceae bacterium]